MKKHVLGIVFFVSIVVLSAVVYSLVSLYSIPSIEDPNAPILEYPKNCYPDHVGKKIKIVQAIATPSDGTLVLDLGRESINGSIGTTIVFHTVNEQGVKFIRAEIVNIENRARVVKYTFDWIKDIRNDENLYVSVIDAEDVGKVPFSKRGATAVLIEKS